MDLLYQDIPEQYVQDLHTNSENNPTGNCAGNCSPRFNSSNCCFTWQWNMSKHGWWWQCVGDQFHWFWLIFLGDFPICPAFATHVPTLLNLVTTVTTHFRTINQWNQQSMVLKCFELSNLSDFWILIPIHRTSDPHRMERMQQIRLHLTMFDCVSLGRRRLVVDQRILRG